MRSHLFTSMFLAVVLGCGEGTGAVVTQPDAPAQPPPPPPANLSAVMVTVGSQHSCALQATGAVYCWGEAAAGQLGDDRPTYRAQTTPVQVVAPVAFVSIAAGTHHTCGLTANGAAYCWGMDYGAVPKLVSDNIAFAALAPGFFHTCGLARDGVAWCWGDNEYGQLGTGTTYPTRSPARVASTERFASLGSGIYATCALSTAGEAWCWGDNQFGTLGVVTAGRCLLPGFEYYGTYYPPREVACAPSPVRVPAPPLRGLVSGVLVNGALVTCGTSLGEDLVCWGSEEEGVPRVVPGARGLTSLAPSAGGWCGLDPEGGIRCWEYLRRDPWWTPVQPFAPALAFQTISGGFGVSCGITRVPAGVVHCWGRNERGQLGDGTTIRRDVPTPVVGPASR